MLRPFELQLHNIVSYTDAIYKFEAGKAIIVVGDNRDNPSQRGNGSGKSGLVEGLAIALTGDCIRDASMKELVRRGEDYGIIKLSLVNSAVGTIVTSKTRMSSLNSIDIERKIYSSKAQEVTLHVNGEQFVCSDVNEYNKKILELLELSKEDLYSFYIITKEYYKPFLSKGDSVKKAIINRFSNADRIDDVIPFVDEEVLDLDKQIKAIEQQISINKGKQEVLSDQIVVEEKKFSEEALMEEVNELKESLESKFSEAEKELELKSELEKNLELKQREFDKTDFQNYDLDIVFLEKEIGQLKKNLSEKKTAITTAGSAHDDLRDEFKKKKAEIKKSISEQEVVLKEVELIKREIENKLAGTIECPKCEHQFVLEEGFDVEEGREQLKEVVELRTSTEITISEHETLLEECNQKEKELEETIRKDGEGLRAKYTEIQSQITEKETLCADFRLKRLEENAKKENMKRNIDKTGESINDSQDRINRLVAEAEDLEKKINSVHEKKSEKLDELTKQLLTYSDEAVEWSERLEAAVENKRLKEQWYTNFKNFKSYLANKSIKNIEDYVNMYLQQMGTDLSIGIEGYRMMTNKKLKEEITTQVLRNGFIEGSYGTFSGGERGRIEVCVILAIQQLINLNCKHGGLDLFIADEIFDSIDSLGLENIVNGLQNISRTILIISQVEVNSLAEYTLTIKKENKISTICQGPTWGLMSGKTEELQSSTEVEESKPKSLRSSGKVKEVKSTSKKLKNSLKS